METLFFSLSECPFYRSDIVIVLKMWVLDRIKMSQKIHMLNTSKHKAAGQGKTIQICHVFYNMLKLRISQVQSEVTAGPWGSVYVHFMCSVCVSVCVLACVVSYIS